jgi:hypothetical protein
MENHPLMKFRLTQTLFLTSALCAAGITQAATTYKPYIEGTVPAAEVEKKLTEAGFEIVGQYEPYTGAKVIVITSDELKEAAADSTFGGYGAVQRVAITDKGDGKKGDGKKVVSYTNPTYWANAYQMNDDLNDVGVKLEKALGNANEFGSKKGLTKKKLRKYHYAPFMPYFTDPVLLATHASHEKAVSAVEAGLKGEKGNQNQTKFVYRVDIAETNETLFGMQVLGDSDGADAKLMSIINKFTGKPEHTAYMPYEILVSGKKVYMLHGKFRIAISFPNLKMMQFMKIKSAPGAIEKAAKAAAK